MDRFIAEMHSEQDEDLTLCRDGGVAYQTDMRPAVHYDAAYYKTCLDYEDKAIALAINAGRIDLVNRHVGLNKVLDVGVGSGEFIKKRGGATFGFDVNPVAMEWLKRNDYWSDRFGEFAALTFWDVIEHVPRPEDYFSQVRLGQFLFTSIPIVYGVGAVRASKHYRPGEHLYYFTEAGFTGWMEMHGFLLLEQSDFEIQAGRESIYTFAFKRIRWPKSSNSSLKVSKACLPR